MLLLKFLHFYWIDSMTLLRFLSKAALATNLTYRVMMTSLLIVGTAYEMYKHLRLRRVVVNEQKLLRGPK